MLNRSGIVFFLSCLLFLAGVSHAAEKAEDFSLPGLDGKTHQLSDYRGKWAVVNYWATWCRPCLEEIPELEVFHHNNHEDLAVVLGLNMEDIEPEKLKAFVEEQFISYPILLAGAYPDKLLGKVPGLPTTYLVSPEGRVVAREVGPVDAESLEKFITGYEKKGGGK